MIRFILIFTVMLGLGPGQGVASETAEKLVQLPPPSLAQWYRPANKRQVWLHNMFKLRREMQAVGEYQALEDAPRLAKWAGRLAEHYRRIGDMVPEWQDELELEVVDALLQAARAAEYEKVPRLMRKLGQSCRSCHREYRAVTALLYRTPDFGKVTVEDSETLETLSYKKLMGRLSLLLNRVKIAGEDGRREAAVESLHELKRRLEDLAQGCGGCHRDDGDPVERILGKASRDSLAAIRQGLETRDAKATGRYLGELAVNTCARCHGVHRTLYDLRRELTP